MPQGSKDAYTDKQKRQAAHIEAGYEKKGISHKAAKAGVGDCEQAGWWREEVGGGAKKIANPALGALAISQVAGEG